MLLAFIYQHTPKCGGDVFFAKNNANTIATCAIVNFIVFTRGVGKKDTLQGIEVCSVIITCYSFFISFSLFSFPKWN
jgi:hypothetical protein